MSSDQTIKEKAVARMLAGVRRKGHSSKKGCPPDSADSGEARSLNKYPFPPTWSPVMPVPVGRIAVQVRQLVDRIQISVPALPGVFDALRDEFCAGNFLFKGEYSEEADKTGRRERKCRFELDGCRVNLVRPEGGQEYPWYRVEVYQPTQKVQTATLKVLGILPRVEKKGSKRQAPWSVAQVEIALDVRPVENQHLGLVRNHIEHGLTHPTLHSQQCGQKCETRYLGRKGHARDGGYGIRTYVKSQAGEADFVRCEVQLNRERLRPLGLRGERGILITPDDVDWVGHLAYRFLDRKRLASSLAAKFKERPGRSVQLRVNILKGETVSAAQDALRALNRKFPGLKLERLLLHSPKQWQLFEDLSQGFVKSTYRTRPFPKTTS